MKKTPLNDICNFEKGSTGLAKAISGEYPLVATSAYRRSCDSFQFDTKAVCIPLVSSTGHGHASLKNVHYQEGKFALGSILVALTAKDEKVIDIQFLHLYLFHFKDSILVPLMTGAANVSLTVTKVKKIEIPLPSIERQKEIVVRFKRIEIEEKELIVELVNQQTLLKKLRQQILQEAIEGKLTKQWRIDNGQLKIEAATELLKRIQAEKQLLIKTKKIKKQKTLSPISNVEKPFELPDSWVWCHLNDLFNFIDYRGKTPEKLSKGIRLITARNVKNGILSLEPQDFISQKEFEERMTRGFPKNGDILFTTEAPLGNICLLNLNDDKVSTGQRLITLQLFFNILNNTVFIFFMFSPFYQDFLIAKATGMTAKGIKASKLKEMLIPLPPLSEQKAIVSKVEKLLALCDQLETQINNNQKHAEKLMQAVLKEAFSQNQ